MKTSTAVILLFLMILVSVFWLLINQHAPSEHHGPPPIQHTFQWITDTPGGPSPASAPSR